MREPSIISIETSDHELYQQLCHQYDFEWMGRKWQLGQVISAGKVTAMKHWIEFVEVMNART